MDKSMICRSRRKARVEVGAKVTRNSARVGVGVSKSRRNARVGIRVRFGGLGCRLV